MNIRTLELEIHTECPSCQQDSHFAHIGSQNYPEAVALKLSLPTIIQIYRCEHCFTTLTDVQLEKRF